ncbi:recombinase family protein [Sulfitobacter geojensis]|uniref:Recombinase family protein n=3 Tax=Sulfitobacter geojensis TaxID=1342299 RepID=A0AAE3B8R4_9RHOB|nr:recombinase family protein [Sulfitobacter geojensis]MBM1691588.1 recombinase family protein [Sulfitobacter geojensis]MBM1695643.1 recombinase family protein [Sulfitobacter geojensis]MBM1707817.1 recombinase family protein [Sulfitobacter geojensis]MBM1711884.1 recombinase family protein [Sulfitobacter geojensis]MBM1715951.1 recombinase family protein [Sulfitobacter geojensis]
MSRTFAYARVSTIEQETENQIAEIKAAGFAVEQHRTIAETVSGSVAIAKRTGFARLLDKMEQGDVLIVTKLDRLGRDAIDVSSTVAKLEALGIRVHCLALGGVDLTSSAGKLTMGVINAVAQFERDLLIERTQAGLVRARAEGKRMGRPPALSTAQQLDVKNRLQAGNAVAAIARDIGVSRQTIMRVRDEA